MSCPILSCSRHLKETRESPLFLVFSSVSCTAGNVDDVKNTGMRTGMEDEAEDEEVAVERVDVVLEELVAVVEEEVEWEEGYIKRWTY
jgi:hypothetical protein